MKKMLLSKMVSFCLLLAMLLALSTTAVAYPYGLISRQMPLSATGQITPFESLQVVDNYNYCYLNVKKSQPFTATPTNTGYEWIDLLDIKPSALNDPEFRYLSASSDYYNSGTGIYDDKLPHFTRFILYEDDKDVGVMKSETSSAPIINNKGKMLQIREILYWPVGFSPQTGKTYHIVGYMYHKMEMGPKYTYAGYLANLNMCKSAELAYVPKAISPAQLPACEAGSKDRPCLVDEQSEKDSGILSSVYFYLFVIAVLLATLGFMPGFEAAWIFAAAFGVAAIIGFLLQFSWRGF